MDKSIIKHLSKSPPHVLYLNLHQLIMVPLLQHGKQQRPAVVRHSARTRPWRHSLSETRSAEVDCVSCSATQSPQFRFIPIQIVRVRSLKSSLYSDKGVGIDMG